MNTNFKVIGLTQLGIKPESTAPEADALTTQPSELLCRVYIATTFTILRNREQSITIFHQKIFATAFAYN